MTDPVVSAWVAFGALSLVAVAASTALRHWRAATWGGPLAAAFGLRRAGAALAGTIDGRAVTLTATTPAGSGSVLRIAVRVPEGAELSWSHVVGDAFALGRRAVTAPSEALPLLGADIRRHFQRTGRSLRDGHLREERVGRHDEASVRELLALARVVEQAVGDEARLRHIASTEDDPWLRGRAIAELEDGAAVDPGPEPIVRLVSGFVRADRHGMRDAIEDLRDVLGPVRVLHDLAFRRATPASVVALAQALGEPELAADEWDALVDVALRVDDAGARHAVVDLLEPAWSEDRRHAGRALLLLLRSDGAVEEAVCTWLGRSADERFDQPGLRWLERHGTVAAVPVLDELRARGRGGALLGWTKKRIQARAGGEHGGLSFAVPVGGELGVAHVVVGEVVGGELGEAEGALAGGHGASRDG